MTDAPTGEPQWSAHITEQDGRSSVTLSGELDLANADELRRLLVAELDKPATGHVVADLTAVTFLDSAALGALISAYRHADETGAQLTLTEPSRPVRRILDISGVYHILVRPAAEDSPARPATDDSPAPRP